MRAVILIILMTPLFTYAQDSINCHFYRFHQANHTAPEMTGYAAIDQALTVTSGETSEATLKLDGKKRAANSTSWILLKPNGWETSSSTYAGNFGELLTISNLSNENTKNSNTWTNASLVRSNMTQRIR